MRFRPDASTPFSVYALGAPVLAGNMYSTGSLCKHPPYMYQVAVGESEHVIFRTDMTPGLQTESDSHEPNTLLFDSFDVNIVTSPSKAMLCYEEIANHYFERDYFNCLISIDIAHGGTIQLEFPLKHLNLLPSQEMWQFETGPVLFLKQDQFETLSEVKTTDLLPYFVHCNRFDKAEFSPDFPFPLEASSRTSSTKSRHIDCRVQLLGNDSPF